MKTPLRAFQAARSRRQADSPRTAFQPGLQPGRRHHPAERRPHRHAARCRRRGTAARTDPPARAAGSARLPDPARDSFPGRPTRASCARAGRTSTSGTPSPRARVCTRSAAWSASRPSTTTSTSARSGSPASSFGMTASRPRSSGVCGTTTEPVCWTQLGYASGYASEFFDTLIVYKEVECAAAGAPPLQGRRKAGRRLGAGRSGSDPVSRAHRDIAGGRPGRAAPQGRRPAPPRALSPSSTV